MCSLEGRSFQGLLNGLSKKNYEKDDTITYEYLIEQLYPGTEPEQQPEILGQIKSVEKILKVAAEHYWDQSTFEENIQLTQLNSQQHRILVAFWMNEREKVSVSLCSDSPSGDVSDGIDSRSDRSFLHLE
jgi:hypothetical protein